MRELYRAAGDEAEPPEERHQPEERIQHAADLPGDEGRRRADSLRERREGDTELRTELREARLAEAAERGLSREEFEEKEATDREDGRHAHQLEIARHRIREKNVWGPPEERAARRQEQYDQQDQALEHFRTVPIEGPQNTPIDPERQRRFVATSWMERRDPPFPPGDLSRRDDLVYHRTELTERTRHPESFALDGPRPELTGTTQPTAESLRERYSHGVDYSDRGHPDLGRYACKTVELENGFDRPEHADVDDRANVVFGWEATPEGKTWHKSGDGRTVLLVDTDLHDQYGHADQRPAPADSDRTPGPVGPSAEPTTRSREDHEPIRLATTDPDHKTLLSKPPADSTVVVDDRFTYKTDHSGRVVHATAQLDVIDLEYPRDKTAQSTLVGNFPVIMPDTSSPGSSRDRPIASISPRWKAIASTWGPTRRPRTSGDGPSNPAKR